MKEIKPGGRILALRTEKGLTQEAAADALGVSNKTFSKWETNAAMPDVETVVRLAEFFGVTVDSLLGIGADGEMQFEDAVRKKFEAEPDNPADALLRMQQAMVHASMAYLYNDARQMARPVPTEKYGEYPRRVVSSRGVYELTVNSKAVNFALTLFRSEEDFGWLKEEDKLAGIASLFAFLSDPDALKLCRAVHDDDFPPSFTAAYMGQVTGVGEEKAVVILEDMKRFGFCTSETAHLADGDCEVYLSHGEGRILGMIALAYEHCFGRMAHELGMNTRMCRLIGGEGK